MIYVPFIKTQEAPIHAHRCMRMIFIKCIYTFGGDNVLCMHAHDDNDDNDEDNNNNDEYMALVFIEQIFI